MARTDNNRIYISSLPSLKEFKRRRTAHQIQHWINVTGIDVYQVYPGFAALGLSVSQFYFPDIFTDGNKLDDAKLGNLTPETYLGASQAVHREAFIQAVNAVLFDIANEIPVCVFCHRGYGRSPLVVATAFNHIYNETLTQSFERVRKLHRDSDFTEMSASALLWAKAQLRNLEAGTETQG